MKDKEDTGSKKKLSLSQPGKLELKKTVEGGLVRQSFSHGRSKVVTVEVKKKRTFEPGNGGGMAEVKEAADWILKTPGGYGAAREICETILRARGDWQRSPEA